MAKISDSILFLTCARDTLKTAISASSLKKSAKIKLRKFITNEATDLQVLSLLVFGDVITEKYNAEKEKLLFNHLRKSFMASKALSKDLKVSLNEIGPISQYGLSTAKPLMEFALAHKKKIITELDAATHGAAAAHAAKETGKAVWGAAKSAGTQLPSGVTNALKAGAEKVAKLKLRLTSGDLDPEVAAATKKQLADKMGELANLQRKYNADIAAAKSARATELAQGAAKGAINKGKEIASQAAEKGKEAVEATGGAVKAGAKALAAKAQAAGHEGVAGALEKVGGASNAAAAAGGVALAAALGFGAMKVYKRFFSQAARACSGKSGDQKTQCMKQFEVKAIQAQIASLKKGMVSCKNGKNPAKCQYALQAKIQKLQSKAQKAATK